MLDGVLPLCKIFFDFILFSMDFGLRLELLEIRFCLVQLIHAIHVPQIIRKILIWSTMTNYLNVFDVQLPITTMISVLLQVRFVKSVFSEFWLGHEFKWFLANKTGLWLVDQIGQQIRGLFFDGKPLKLMISEQTDFNEIIFAIIMQILLWIHEINMLKNIFILGSVQITATQIVCPKHFEPPESKKKTTWCHVSTGWCFICSKGIEI